MHTLLVSNWYRAYSLLLKTLAVLGTCGPLFTNISLSTRSMLYFNICTNIFQNNSQLSPSGWTSKLIQPPHTTSAPNDEKLQLIQLIQNQHIIPHVLPVNFWRLANGNWIKSFVEMSERLSYKLCIKPASDVQVGRCSFRHTFPCILRAAIHIVIYVKCKICVQTVVCDVWTLNPWSMHVMVYI